MHRKDYLNYQERKVFYVFFLILTAGMFFILCGLCLRYGQLFCKENVVRSIKNILTLLD